MRTKTIKRIFIFFICYLPLQYALVGIVGYYKSEPWPAFVFPGFKNVYVFDEIYIINRFHFEVISSENEARSVLHHSDFFYDIPLTKIPGFIRTRLSDQKVVNGFSSDAKQWFTERAEELVGKPVDRIVLVHERSFMKRQPDRTLARDSLRVVSRLNILNGY